MLFGIFAYYNRYNWCKTMIDGNDVLITSTSTSSNVLFFSGFNLWHRIVTVFSFGVNDELEWFELEDVFADVLDFRAIFGVLWLPMLRRLDILLSLVVLKLSFGLKSINGWKLKYMVINKSDLISHISYFYDLELLPLC